MAMYYVCMKLRLYENQVIFVSREITMDNSKCTQPVQSTIKKTHLALHMFENNAICYTLIGTDYMRLVRIQTATKVKIF